MKKKTKILIPLAVVTLVVATIAYVKYPISVQEPFGMLIGNRHRSKVPSTPAAKVDAAVDAIVQGYDQDQGVVQKEDADANYVSQDSQKINSLSGVYNENNF